jgi:hypothetical protein
MNNCTHGENISFYDVPLVKVCDVRFDLAEIRWVLKDATGMKLPPPARTTTDLKGQAPETMERSGRTALRDRQLGVGDLNVFLILVAIMFTIMQVGRDPPSF